MKIGQFSKILDHFVESAIKMIRITTDDTHSS